MAAHNIMIKFDDEQLREIKSHIDAQISDIAAETKAENEKLINTLDALVQATACVARRWEEHKVAVAVLNEFRVAQK